MKVTPIQKAIEYCPDECVAMRNYLQSLLAEERQMVEDAYQTGGNNFDLDAGRPKPYPSDYFTQAYQQ